MSSERRHSRTCGVIGYCNGCAPTPVPSEVAETTAGEREVEALSKVLGGHTLSHHGTTFGGFTPCRCSCGMDFACPIFQSWEICGHYHRAHVATHLAALLDRVRREEGAKVLREAATDYARGPDYFDRHSATARWLRDRAASVGRVKMSEDE